MKNALILGLVALLLFSVSATLSVWLNQPSPSAETTTQTAKAATRKSAAKDRPGADEGDREGEPIKPAIRPKPHSGSDDVNQLTNQVGEQMSALREREGRLERRQSQLDVVMGDIRAERQVIDTIRKSAAVELKQLGEKIAELERKANELEQQRQTMSKTATDLQRRQTEQDEGEKKNVDRMASMYDSMPAENAARILQQMADMGKLDTAAKLLSQMKERQAAKVLAEITDSALAVQLLERMRILKRNPPASAAVPTP